MDLFEIPSQWAMVDEPKSELTSEIHTFYVQFQNHALIFVKLQELNDKYELYSLNYVSFHWPSPILFFVHLQQNQIIEM